MAGGLSRVLIAGGRAGGALTIEQTNKSVRFIGIDPQMPSTLYAGVAHRGGVYKSTDGGVLNGAIGTQDYQVDRFKPS